MRIQERLIEMFGPNALDRIQGAREIPMGCDDEAGPAYLCASGDDADRGALFVSGGGTVLFAFPSENKGTSRHWAVAYNDDATKTWKADPRPMHERTPHYCPNPVLRLVMLG
jgi:hypothetical protein